MRISSILTLAASAAILTACGHTTVPNVPSEPRSSLTDVNNLAQLTTTTTGPQYTILALPTSLVPATLNDSGTIVGGLLGPCPPCGGAGAVTYKNGHMTKLEPLAGDTTTEAVDINNVGISVGDSLASGGAGHPVQYTTAGLAQRLQVGTASAYHSNNAVAINNYGKIVGVLDNNGSAGQIAFLSTSHVPVALGIYGMPLSIDDYGDVAGYTQISPQPGDNRGFLYGGLTPCGASAAYTDVENFALNSSRHFIEHFRALNGAPAGKPSELYLLCAKPQTALLQGTPFAMNAGGSIVGQSAASSAGTTFAYLRTPGGQYYNLNTLVPRGSGNYYLATAFAINRCGQILAYANHAAPNGGPISKVYYLLTPRT